MENQQLDKSVLEKLQKLIKNRFGKEIQLRQLTDMRLQQQSGECHLIGPDLHVALKQDDQFLGTVVVPDASDLKSESRQQMTQMIRMVMEPALYSWFLERKENNLQQISQFNFSTENLSVFEDLILDEAELNENEDDFFHLNQEVQKDGEHSRKSQLVSKLIHLTGKTESMNRKVALQIHDMAHRWAFVPIQDIAASVANVDDLRRLGALTIYAADIEKLDERIQSILVAYLNQEANDDEPLIISTSAKTNLDLQGNESLVVDLKEKIMINSFEVDQAPLSYSHLKEVLEMFFFKPSLS